MRVRELVATHNKLDDVSPLANKTISYLDLSNNTIKDATPLLNVKGLKTLIISPATPNIELLKDHPTLEIITGNAGLLELEDINERFWAIVEKIKNKR